MTLDESSSPSTAFNVKASFLDDTTETAVLLVGGEVEDGEDPGCVVGHGGGTGARRQRINGGSFSQFGRTGHGSFNFIGAPKRSSSCGGEGGISGGKIASCVP